MADAGRDDLDEHLVVLQWAQGQVLQPPVVAPLVIGAGRGGYDRSCTGCHLREFRGKRIVVSGFPNKEVKRKVEQVFWRTEERNKKNKKMGYQYVKEGWNDPQLSAM